MHKNISALLFSLISLYSSAQEIPNNKSFNKLLEKYYIDGIKLRPLSATQRGDNRYNHVLLNDISAPHIKKVLKYNNKYLKKVECYNKESLNSFDKISYDIITLQINQAIEGKKYHLEQMPFDHKNGLPVDLPSYGSGKSIQPFKTVKDYKNWLKRIHAFTIWSDTAISNFNKGIASGMVLPKSLVIKIIPQLESHTTNDFDKNLFYGPIKNFPSSFSEKEKRKLTIAYQIAINKEIIPTYKKLADYLKNTYLPHARTTSGFNALPNGDEIYQYKIRVFTTTNKSPEEIYQTGIDEVKRITNEIDALRIKVGFNGTLKEFFDYALKDKQFFPFKTEKDVLDGFWAILPQIEPNLDKLFNIRPKTKFDIKAVEKYKAASSSASYQRGAEDGSRPGYFNVPIVDATKYNKLGMENLFLHEAIPGHHFQLSLQQENPAFPSIRKFASYSVFSEGWALYTESLGEELGLYSDPFQKLAAYKGELFRSIRLVTDVGLHTGKMTREEAIKYMMEKGGRDEQGSISETERYMSNPGQALSYKIGELKIQELKSKYQKRLGSKFNIKNFHDAILLGGSMPLTVFENYMNNWAESQL